MIPIDKEQVRLLEQRLRGIGVDRRTFLKIAGAAMATVLHRSVRRASHSTTVSPAVTAAY